MTHRGITPQQELFMAILLIGIAFFMLFSLHQPDPPKVVPVPVVDPDLPPVAKAPPDGSHIKPISGEKAFFDTLSSLIPANSELESRLREVAREIAAKGSEGKFDGLEVVGHADPALLIRPRDEGNHVVTFRKFEFPADLDSLMAARIRSDLSIRLPTRDTPGHPSRLSEPITVPGEEEWKKSLTPSNVDLAMLRALMVVKFLREYKETDPARPKLDFIKKYLPLSAGAFITPGGDLDVNPANHDSAKTAAEIENINKTRRRIEFHLFHVDERFPSVPEPARPVP